MIILWASICTIKLQRSNICLYLCSLIHPTTKREWRHPPTCCTNAWKAWFEVTLLECWADLAWRWRLTFLLCPPHHLFSNMVACNVTWKALSPEKWVHYCNYSLWRRSDLFERQVVHLGIKDQIDNLFASKDVAWYLDWCKYIENCETIRM